MVSQHGWRSKPSPRRGFTVVEALRGATGSPVVLAVHDSSQGIRLFRMAVDEAMGRHRDLVVLDYGTSSLHEAIDDGSGVDPRERRTLRALRSNQHVRLMRMRGGTSLESAVAYCEATKACLLVIAAEQIGSSPIDRGLAGRIFKGEFDVLLVADVG